MLESTSQQSNILAYLSDTTRQAISKPELDSDDTTLRFEMNGSVQMGSRILLGAASGTETSRMNVYSTPTITVEVGLDQDRKLYFVHRGIFWKFQKIDVELGKVLTIPDVTPTVFELALSFLYSGNYTCSSLDASLNEKEQLETHSSLYCFASRYHIEGLIDLTIRNIRGLKQVAYLHILNTAQQIYPRLQGNDRLYRDYFVDETKKAMAEDISLAQEPRILDLFGEEKGHLTRDLFVALSGCVRSEIALTPGTSVSGSPPSEAQDDVLLKSQEAQEPWTDYLTSCYDRDQMEVVGKALGAALLTDIWRFFRWDISFNGTPDISLYDPAIKDMKEAGGATSKVLKEVTLNILERVSKDIGSDTGSAQCPNRDKHLTNQDGEWAWESCTTCMRDRELFATKIKRYVDSYETPGDNVRPYFRWAYNINKENPILATVEKVDASDVPTPAQDLPMEPIAPPMIDLDAEQRWSDGESSSDGDFEPEEDSEGDSEFWSDEEEDEYDEDDDEEDDGEEEERKAKSPAIKKSLIEDQGRLEPPPGEPKIKDSPAPISVFDMQFSSSGGLKRKDAS